MKLIIAGGRTYRGNCEAILALNEIGLIYNVEEVVSGGADGADRLGEKWARSLDIPVKRFPANWTLYGRSAGPRRNAEMADYADAVVLFPGGIGTANMRQQAEQGCLQIFDLTNPKVY